MLELMLEKRKDHGRMEGAWKYQPERVHTKTVEEEAVSASVVAMQLECLPEISSSLDQPAKDLAVLY